MRGLCDQIKQKQIFRHIHERKAHIICLQETHADKKCQKLWRNEFGGEMYFSNGESNARGVAILFSRNVIVQDVECKRDNDGRFILVSYKN